MDKCTFIILNICCINLVSSFIYLSFSVLEMNWSELVCIDNSVYRRTNVFAYQVRHVLIILYVYVTTLSYEHLELDCEVHNFWGTETIYIYPVCLGFRHHFFFTFYVKQNELVRLRWCWYCHYKPRILHLTINSTGLSPAIYGL